jgi:FixJ family two-component response regulator
MQDRLADKSCMSKPRTHVAIVDDDAAVRKALGRLLRVSTFDTAIYGSAREFLASLNMRVPHCLLVDLHMPDMTGLELQRHLARARIDIPTIVITAHDEPGTRELCMSAGAKAYLVKPVPDIPLISAINDAVGLRPER